MDKVLVISKINYREKIEFKEGMRFSIWLEGELDYLMPSEFNKQINKCLEDEIIEIKVLDPAGKISMNSIEKKVFIGIPNKVFCLGYISAFHSPPDAARMSDKD